MAATTSSFQIPRTAPPSDPNLPGGSSEGLNYRNPFTPPQYPSTNTASTPPPSTPPPAPSQQQDEKTCRICLETSTPTSPPDPLLGRLLSPCKCRGSAKYVHEECLNRWRTMSSNQKSYYQCGTCGYKYRLRRLWWAAWVGSKSLQLTLTIAILLTTVYILGFIADPILNIYLSSSSLPSPPPQLRPLIYQSTATPATDTDSTSTTTEDSTDENGDDDDDDPLRLLQTILLPAPGSLAEHMLKGLTSLGLLGFAKVILFFGPQSWWNLRASGVLGGAGGGGGGARAGRTGRDRLGQLGWVVVLVGVWNFLRWVWGVVSQWTRGWLGRRVEGILDVEEEEEGEGRGR